MMDEFHCFGAWEFVRGELLSFCCVRLLESVTRDKMSFFLPHGVCYSMIRQSCEFNVMSIYPCKVCLAEIQEFLNVTWKFREKNWLIACPFCDGGIWMWGRLTEHNGGCCLYFWIFGWRIDAAKKPAKSLARRTSWVILASFRIFGASSGGPSCWTLTLQPSFTKKRLPEVAFAGWPP